MKKLSGSLIVLLILAALAKPDLRAQSVSTVTVHVKWASGSSSGPVAGTQVSIVYLTEKGPDASMSRLNQTLADGSTTFYLEPGREYEIFASSSGYYPTLRDQMFDPEHARLQDPATGQVTFSTITLHPGLTDAGTVEVNIAAASAGTLVFGDVRVTGREPVAFGMCGTDGTGACVMKIPNVAAAAAGTYEVSAFDAGPGVNKATGAVISQAVTNGGTAVVALDFTNALPPQQVESVISEGYEFGNAGRAGVDGIVVDTATAAPLSFIDVNYIGHNCGGCGGEAHTDINGRFKIYGLLPGTTYHLKAMGSCDWDADACYEGHISTWMSLPGTGAYDFVYPSTDTTIQPSIGLFNITGSTGSLPVYVKTLSGNPVPYVWVEVWGDESKWHTDDSKNCDDTSSDAVNSGTMRAGEKTDSQGFAHIKGLPPGNYVVSLYSAFSQLDTQYNKGSSATWTTGADPAIAKNRCNAPGNWRVTADPADPEGFRVYSASGTELGFSSVTIHLDDSQAAPGQVNGTIYFDGNTADHAPEPVIVALSRYGAGPKGGFKSLNVTSQPSETFSINVASGVSYSLGIGADYWGLVYCSRNQFNGIDLTGTDTLNLTLKTARAGCITGTLYRPDGTAFRETDQSVPCIWAYGPHMGNTGFSGSTTVNKDGSFRICGYLPGEYRLGAAFSPDFPYTNPMPLPEVTVYGGKDSQQDIRLVRGLNMYVQVDTSTLYPAAQNPDGGTGLLAYAFPSGTVFDRTTLLKLLRISSEETNRQMMFSPPGEGCWGTGAQWPGGFCPAIYPSPGIYDAYLVYKAGIHDPTMQTPAGDTHAFFSLLNSTGNIVVNNDSLAAFPAGVLNSTSAVPVDLTPKTGMAGTTPAVLRGNISALNMLSENDFGKFKRSPGQYIDYAPIVTLYDPNGDLKAGGLVTPHPRYLTSAFGDLMENYAGADDWPNFIGLMKSVGWGFEIQGLAPYETYTMVVTGPNYPPYQQRITLGGQGSVNTADVNLDQAVRKSSSISGVVKSTAGAAIANAVVTINSDAIDEKTFTTGSTGEYSAPGLPAGAYKIEVAASGYARAAMRVNVPINTAARGDFTGETYGLYQAPGFITGTVYSQKVPFAKVQPGARIIAYNDTFNHDHPTAEVALLTAKTDSRGEYRLDGLIPGDSYLVSLNVHGKYTLSRTTTALAAGVPDINFVMMSKPVEMDVFGKPDNDAGFYEFTIKNPLDYLEGAAWFYPDTRSFSPATAVPVTDQAELPGNQRRLRIPLSALDNDRDYYLHLITTSTVRRAVEKDLPFGKNRNGSAEQTIDHKLLGDDTKNQQGRRENEAILDETGGDHSYVSFPAGAMFSISSSAVPNLSFTNMSVDASTVADKAGKAPAGAFAGDIYKLEISSVNFTDRGFDLALQYDAANTHLNDVAVYGYDDNSASWEIVDGLQTVNPLTKTVSVRLKGLASVLGIKRSARMKALYDGRSHVVNPLSLANPVDSGVFAVMRLSVMGEPYAGSKFKVFNFPNPFNLKQKTVSVNTEHCTSLDCPAGVTGTVIKYEIPPSVPAGSVSIRIYTAAGELVRELDEGVKAGGRYHYTTWDGRNKNGEEVANGVYYGMIKMPGVKAKESTFKMAVIK